MALIADSVVQIRLIPKFYQTPGSEFTFVKDETGQTAPKDGKLIAGEDYMYMKDDGKSIDQPSDPYSQIRQTQENQSIVAPLDMNMKKLWIDRMEKGFLSLTGNKNSRADMRTSAWKDKMPDEEAWMYSRMRLAEREREYLIEASYYSRLS
ncbi:unnamed protein product [Arabis nemorensis]|uniref:Uncharacterized protein n=1 Tax=Arabis nemorensis TaxID=586526 RepID=A0A565CUV0_9BRAS|nr:unnamed protein product [Arabis nemorensis]